jgi:hypothetical protein
VIFRLMWLLLEISSDYSKESFEDPENRGLKEDYIGSFTHTYVVYITNLFLEASLNSLDTGILVFRV